MSEIITLGMDNEPQAKRAAFSFSDHDLKKYLKLRDSGRISIPDEELYFRSMSDPELVGFLDITPQSLQSKTRRRSSTPAVGSDFYTDDSKTNLSSTTQAQS